MTYERREQILAKEVITTSEFAELFGISYSDASSQINAIKRRIEADGKIVRIKKQGKLHVQDYLDCFGIQSNRYEKKRVQYERFCGDRED